MSDKGEERRGAKRRPILDTFSLFIVVPKKGPYKLRIHDISENGVGFYVDEEGESPDGFPLSAGELLEVRFYLNQSLYIPLTIKVARVTDAAAQGRLIGGNFHDMDSRTHKTFVTFVSMLDSLIDVGKIDSP